MRLIVEDVPFNLMNQNRNTQVERAKHREQYRGLVHPTAEPGNLKPGCCRRPWITKRARPSLAPHPPTGLPPGLECCNSQVMIGPHCFLLDLWRMWQKSFRLAWSTLIHPLAFIHVTCEFGTFARWLLCTLMIILWFLYVYSSCVLIVRWNSLSSKPWPFASEAKSHTHG